MTTRSSIIVFDTVELAATARRGKERADRIEAMADRLRSAGARTVLNRDDPALDGARADHRLASAVDRMKSAATTMRTTATDMAEAVDDARRADGNGSGRSDGLNRWLNRTVVPAAGRLAVEVAETVFDLADGLGRVGRPPSPTPNEPGGPELGYTFSRRPVGRFGPPLGYPVFVTPTRRGRRAIADEIMVTGDPERLAADEMLVVDHGNNHYTIVLAGVVDLSRPRSGFDPTHRSVRDLDRVAFPSAAGTSMADNLYAQTVRDAVAGTSGPRLPAIPPGATVAIVGHSLGADTALDLAADPAFNQVYTISHVVAAGYWSQPQLAALEAAPGRQTEVLVLQNRHDAVVAVTALVHRPEAAEKGVGPAAASIDRFDGGWAGGGHHQSNYVDHILNRSSPAVDAFAHSFDAAGFTAAGTAVAIDISAPLTPEPGAQKTSGV